MIRNGLAIPLEGSWSGRVIIMDEPTAAAGVKEFHACWSRFLDVKTEGLPIVPISHNMPHSVRGVGPHRHPAHRGD